MPELGGRQNICLRAPCGNPFRRVPRVTVIRSRTLCSRVRPRCYRQPRREEAGFVLLLGFCGGLVLLLSSLSIQTAVLQARSSAFSLLRRRQQDDALASAAQLLIGRLAAVPCTLGLSRSDWTVVSSTSGSAPCISAAMQAQLEGGTLPGPDAADGRFLLTDYTLQRYGNVIDGAQLTVQWMPARGRMIQRRFRVLLAATGSAGSWQLQGVRP